VGSIPAIDVWLKICLSDHTAHGVSDVYIPMRVIDVNLSDTSLEPFLYIPKDLGKGRYVALSHCWGAKMEVKLTAETLEMF